MCCYDASQIVNSEIPTYEADTGKALKDLTMNLRNDLHAQAEGVTIINTIEAVGIVPRCCGNCFGLDSIMGL
jgi:hypothetical protein